ncbi:phospho-N-acetylmuramoyl-pentapeptide-transferase [Peptostreptococcus anaerobius]|uniref:phospho-N-acetylmuramoyl-pentapeptide- transferase n=1 Tax=Peptostreptococcus anaerobius TaxID=1261 RepID=UPI003562F7D5
MIGFRSIAITVLMSYILVMVMGPFLIPVLHKMKFGQTVRDDGPQSHLKKNGTPTMGGVMFMVAITAVTLLRAGINANVLMALLCMLGFGLIGLMDDLVKIKMTRSLGLTAKQKILLQVILAFAVSYYQYKVVGDGSQFIVPFVQAEINIGIAYIPFMMIVVLGTVNAVNLTDGLDGLASGITAIVALFFTIFAFIVVQNVEISQFAAATLGACIGFMWFNVNPAKVFMGDNGSMALGGAVTAFALFTNSALLIPIVGGIYFAEALSVIIQVLYFKKTRKRVFKMAPLHHHYEQCGWPETKVVFIFWLVAALLAIIGVVAMF